MKQKFNWKEPKRWRQKPKLHVAFTCSLLFKMNQKETKPKATLPSIIIHQMQKRFYKKKQNKTLQIHVAYLVRTCYIFQTIPSALQRWNVTQLQARNIATQNWSLPSLKQDDSLWTERADDICSPLLQLERYMCELSPWQRDLIALSWPTSLRTHCPKPLCSQSSTSQWPALSGWLALSNHLDGFLRASQVISGESLTSPQQRKKNCILFIIYSAVY